MSKKREGDPFMPPPEYGHSLSGLTLNVLVTDMDRAVLFAREVLAATIIYSDPDITIAQAFGSQWMIHSDHTYDKHPLHKRVSGVSVRGIGAEIRLHGRDPDQAVSRAKELGFEILDGPRDQPDHGLREAHIIDQDGYVWAPDVKIKDEG